MTSEHMPEISIIMPVFNGVRFLERSIRSVLAQRFREWELIAVDDCSDDDSFQFLCRFSRTEPRIRSFRLSENRGPGGTRNEALQYAKGSMIAYLDCDDEYYPDYLHWVARCRYKGDVLVCPYDVEDERGIIMPPNQIFTWDPAWVRMTLLSMNVSVPLGVAHHRELLGRVGFFNEAVEMIEDWDLWRRFALAGAEFVYLPIKSGLYHIRAGSWSRIDRVPRATPPTNAKGLPKEAPIWRRPLAK
jgi:glycosyltransferase involved in cell wall biosynthesis